MKKLLIWGFVLGLVLIQSLSWAEDKNKPSLPGGEKGPEKGVLLGTVTDASGKALPATISFEDSQIPAIKADPKTGKFQVELAPDKYKIKAEAAGYEPADKKVKVKAGEVAPADFQLKSMAPAASVRGVLFGTVTDASGKVLAAAVSFDDPKVPALKTDPKTGKYRVELAPEKYQVKVEAAGYEPADKKVKVKAGEESPADFQLKAMAPAASVKGVLFGTVTDASGKPLPATISFGDSRIAVLKADPKTGGYRGEVPAGKNKFTVQAAGYESQEEKVKIQIGTETRVDFRLELKQGANPPNQPKETINADGISSYAVSQTTVIKELTSRPQVDAEIKKLMMEIGNLGQDLTKLETDIYLLREKVLEGKPVGAIARLVLINNLNRIFDIKKIEIKIDDQVVFDQEDQGDKFDTHKENELFQGAISPGSHQVATLVLIQGRGWGLFGYFQKYNFELRLSRIFYFSEGQISNLKLNCVDRGGRFELKDRLRLDSELVGQEPSQK